MKHQRFQVIFTGDILPGRPFDEVKENLARRFKTDAKKIEVMFTGKKTVIKSGVDYETASKYLKILKQDGAKCKVARLEGPSTSPHSHSTQTPGAIICPKCNHRQSQGETCVYCGVSIKDYRRPSPEAPAPEPNSTEAAPASEEAAAPSFLSRLCDASGDEGEEARRIIIGAAIVGGIGSFFWGGMFNPWQESPFQTGGFAPAVLNFFLFGLWGLLEVLSMLGARNFGVIKRRIGLMFVGGLAGGFYVSFFTVLQIATVPSFYPPDIFAAALTVLAAFIIGGAISALCTIKLNIVMLKDGSLDSFAIVILLIILTGTVAYKFITGDFQSDYMWTYKTGYSPEAMEIWHDRLIVAESGPYLSALDRHTGEQIWRKQTDAFVRNRIHVKEDVLFYASGGEPSKPDHFHAVHLPSGDELWRLQLDFRAAGVAFSGDVAALRGVMGGVYMLDLEDRGLKKLHLDASPYAMARPPVIADGALFALGGKGELIALNIKTGKRLWTFPVETDRFHADLVVAGGIIYFPAGKELIAVDKTGGREIWRSKAASYILSQKVDDQRVYFGTQRHVCAVEITSGQIVWKYGEGLPMRLCAVRGQTALAAGTDLNQKLYGLDAASGREKWTLDLEFSPDTPVIQGDAIYLSGVDSGFESHVYALDLSRYLH